MIFRLEKKIIEDYLSDNQKQILNLVFFDNDHETAQKFEGEFISTEKTVAVASKPDEDGNAEISHSDEDDCENEFEKKMLLYPVRFLLNEKNFFSLSRETGNTSDRSLKIICYSRELNRIAGIHFYRSSFSEIDNYSIQGNEIILNPDVKMHDILQIAGYLSAFSEIVKISNSKTSVVNNFPDLPFSARRYYIENIILSRKPTQGFFYLEEAGYLKDILPEVAAGKNLSQNKFHKYDIYEHLIRSCEAMEVPDLVLRFSALLHDIGKVSTRRVKENGEATFYNHEMVSSYMLVPIMKRFGIPKSIGIKVKYYVRNHMFHYTDEWSDKAVRRFLRKVSRPDLENLILLRKSDRIGSGKTNPFPKKLQNLIDHIDDIIMRDLEMKVTDLEIDGLDLMNMGVPQGPQIGKILSQLLNEVKNEITRNEPAELTERARQLIQAAQAGVAFIQNEK